MIRTKWQRENQQVTFNVEIPANVIATLLVPGMDEKVVGSGKYTFTVND